MNYVYDILFKKWVVIDGDMVLKFFDTEKEAAEYVNGQEIKKINKDIEILKELKKALGIEEEEFIDEMYNDDFDHIN